MSRFLPQNRRRAGLLRGAKRGRREGDERPGGADGVRADDARIGEIPWADTDDEADRRYGTWINDDPYPDIPPAF